MAGPALVALLSAVASVISQLGDLGESALKRRFDVKDSAVSSRATAASWTASTDSGSVSLLVGLLLALRYLWS